MSPVDQTRMSASALTPPLTPTDPEPLSAQAPAAGEPDPVSAEALTPADPEHQAEVAALLTERYAPDAAHGTDDNAVRRALDAAARTRRW